MSVKKSPVDWQDDPHRDAVVGRAEALVREFPGCFWFWRHDARVTDRHDMRLVIRHLRQYGDRRAWKAAQDLQKCL